jgi:hypothetical protein
MREAAGHVKRVTLELGRQVTELFFSPTPTSKRRSTERCSACSSLRAKSVQRAAGCWSERKIYTSSSRRCPPRPGHPARRSTRRQTKMGPLVSKEQFDRWRCYQELRQEAKRSGDRRQPSRRTARGFYVEPTIFYDVDNNAGFAREEIFGPGLRVNPLRQRAGCARIATTRRTARGLRCGRATSTKPCEWSRRSARDRSGSTHAADLVEAPWGGYKQSGFRAANLAIRRRRISRNQPGAHQSQGTNQSGGTEASAE